MKTTTNDMLDVIQTAEVYLTSDNMREAADKLGVSVWTVHHRLNKRLPEVHSGLHEEVRERIEKNLALRYERGGRATLGLIRSKRFVRR